MSSNPSSSKAKIRPGRKSLRSESGSENALRRSTSRNGETLDYEIAPTPSVNASSGSSVPSGNPTSSDSMRHMGLNFGESLTEDTETPPVTPTSARAAPKYGATRELPKNWSDDESSSLTEPESVKSGDESTPTGHRRTTSKSSAPLSTDSRRTSNADSDRPAGGRLSNAQEPERASSPVFHHLEGHVRSNTQEFDRLSSSQTLRPEKSDKSETRSKRSSANARVSPRSEKKSVSYTAVVSREKLDRANQSVLNWVRITLSQGKCPVTISGWDSFKDGVAFVHLIHHCDASVINLEEFDTSDPLRTLEAAFDIAEVYLGIPNIFDPKAFFDSKFVESGPDARTLFIYLSHFRTVSQERNKANNPVATARTLVSDLKLLVSRKISQVESLSEEFDSQTLRLAALTTRDELHAEKEYLQQRALTMDKMMDMSIRLNSELESQNLSLREQNRLLNENVALLKKSVDQHKVEKEAALAQLDMAERMKAMAELLEEPDLDKFIALHMEEIEKLVTPPSAAPATSTTPAPSDTPTRAPSGPAVTSS